MKFEFDYKIIEVDEKLKTMDVIFSCEGKESIFSKIRIPFKGENLKDVILRQAPIHIWRDKLRESFEDVVPITAGKISYDSEKGRMSLPNFYPGYFCDKEAAKNFFINKNINTNPFYVCTMFNITTNEILTHVFRDDVKNNFVKIKNGLPTEWYEMSNFVIEDKQYSFISKDLSTGEIIDKYFYTEDGSALVKFSEKSPKDRVITRFQPFEKIDSPYREMIEHFEYKDHIIAWSSKKYGLIVEFKYIDITHS